MIANPLRACRVVLGLVVAATLVQGGAARADQQAAGVPLGGYNGSAAASGLHAYYNAGDVLPLPPPVDLGAPDALATIASGPATYARASVLDPGDLLANPDALLALASSSYPGGVVPPYPYRVTVTSSTGPPTAEVAPAPGLAARVQADGHGSTATATTPVVQAPAVATFGAASSTGTTQTDGSSVTVHAVSKLQHLDVLGIIAIDSVTTDLAATSSGGDTKLTGGTKVEGATLMGQAITIDADGIHGGNGSGSLLAGVVAPLTGNLNTLLGAVGIHITVASPVTVAGAGAGNLASAGLRIDIELSQRTLPALGALLKALPPIENPIPGTPSIEDLLQVAKARHLVSIEVARGAVSLEARPGYDAAATPSSTPSGDTGTTGAFDVPGTGPPYVSPSLALPTPGGPSLAPTLTSGPPSVPKAFGIGSLVLLALLSLPFIGDRLAFAAGAILAADPTDACPLEEP